MSKPSISPASLSWRLKDVISSNWFVRGEEEERKRRRTLQVYGVYGVYGGVRVQGMPGRTRCLTRVNATRVRYWCSRIVYPVCCDGYVGVSLLYSLSGECREEDVHGSVYLCERGDSVAAAHWPSCYDVNVDQKKCRMMMFIYMCSSLVCSLGQPTRPKYSFVHSFPSFSSPRPPPMAIPSITVGVRASVTPAPSPNWRTPGALTP